MNYFIIPGNPPAVHFYQEWGKEIIKKSPHSQVTVSPYPKLVKNPNSAHAMKEIVKIHSEQLMEFYQKNGQAVSIIGHSLGGNIALRLLHEDSKEVIQKTILLHPFLRRPEKSGQFILNAAAFFYGKEILQKLVIKNRKYLEYLSSELPHVTDEEIEKAFHIARHESNTIANDLSFVHISHEKRDKVSVFYHVKDRWCTGSVIKDLKGQVKLIECTEPHGFVTSKVHRENLFEKIMASVL